jgi:hypothetical protein
LELIFHRTFLLIGCEAFGPFQQKSNRTVFFRPNERFSGIYENTKIAHQQRERRLCAKSDTPRNKIMRPCAATRALCALK